MRHLFSGFFAGFLAVLTVHQAVIAAGGALGFLRGATGWAMRPVPPLGIPQVLSLAFWGGIWGIPLAALASRMGKGRPVADLSATRLMTGLVINGAWALGALAILGLLRRFSR